MAHIEEEKDRLKELNEPIKENSDKMFQQRENLQNQINKSMEKKE